MKRKVRKGELVCRCGAYRFPHRQMGGACDGGAFVQKFFDLHLNRDCRNCHLIEELETEFGCETICQALDGRESFLRCPALEDHIRFNEIPLYGVNKP